MKLYLSALLVNGHKISDIQGMSGLFIYHCDINDQNIIIKEIPANQLIMYKSVDSTFLYFLLYEIMR